MPDSPLQTDSPELKKEGVDEVTETLKATSLREDVLPEGELFNISFAEYNHKECLVDNIRTENAKPALKILRDIGVYFTDESNFKKHSSSELEIKPVLNLGDYSDLFRGLNHEYHDSVKEIKYDKKGHKNKPDIKLRIFFTLLESEKIFYLIAIRDVHYSTDKSHNKRS